MKTSQLVNGCAFLVWVFESGTEFLKECFKVISVPTKVQTKQGLCSIIKCQWVQFELGHLDKNGMKLNDYMHLVDKASNFWMCSIKLVKQVDLWFLVVALWKHTPRMSKLDYFEDEQWIHEKVVVYFFAYF